MPWITEGDGTRTWFDPVRRTVAPAIVAPEVRPVKAWVPPVVPAPRSITRRRTLPVIVAPGAGYGKNIGTGGENESPDPFDHVDDFGSAPPSGIGTLPPPIPVPFPITPAVAVPTPVTPENMIHPNAGNLFDLLTPGTATSPGELWGSAPTTPSNGGILGKFPDITAPFDEIGNMMQMMLMMALIKD